MNTSFVASFRGYVRIEVKGQKLEELINRMVQLQLHVWDIGFTDASTAMFTVSLPDFFRLRPLLKETGSRLRIKQKHGIPFKLDKLGRRKFFAAGLVGFIIGIYMLSSVVWQVRVEGNDNIQTSDVLQAARQQGIYQLQWKFRLKNPEELARNLQTTLPGTAWIGVEISGTHVVIKVVEAKLPDTKPLVSPRHLVASKSAMVTEIFAEKGKPLVRPNTYVRKGDILISGVIGDETHQQTVVAAGKVKGLVWYMPQVEVPLTQGYKAYTGDTLSRYYFVIGNRGLQVTGYGAIPYETFETIPERHNLEWRNFHIPIGWLKEKVMETKQVGRQLDPKEAETIGLVRARSEILSQAGEGSRVVSEKILHQKTENGKVYMEVHFEIEEYIAEELPIVP